MRPVSQYGITTNLWAGNVVANTYVLNYLSCHFSECYIACIHFPCSSYWFHSQIHDISNSAIQTPKSQAVTRRVRRAVVSRNSLAYVLVPWCHLGALGRGRGCWGGGKGVTNAVLWGGVFFKGFYVSVWNLDNEQGELDILIDEHPFDIISITKKK